MFRFTRKPSSGSHSHCLAKITRSVQCTDVVVLWLHSTTCEACVLCTAHTPHRSYYVVCISWTIKVFNVGFCLWCIIFVCNSK
jgi:hypothetical protein